MGPPFPCCHARLSLADCYVVALGDRCFLLQPSFGGGHPRPERNCEDNTSLVLVDAIILDNLQRRFALQDVRSCFTCICSSCTTLFALQDVRFFVSHKYEHSFTVNDEVDPLRLGSQRGGGACWGRSTVELMGAEARVTASNGICSTQLS